MHSPGPSATLLSVGDQLVKEIISCLEEVVEGLDLEEKPELGPETVLFGRTGLLDSRAGQVPHTRSDRPT